MPAFLHAHAAAADWHVALRQAAAQIEAQQRAAPAQGVPTLGFVYLTQAYEPDAQAILAALRRRWPGVAWAGAVGVGIAASGVEYFGTPALALMLAPLPRGQWRVFSGTQPLGTFAAHAALVHADPATPELSELIAEMSERMAGGYLFGGLTCASSGGASHIADGVFRGGLSGVAFGEAVHLVSRVTQGSQPMAAPHRITAAEGNLVLTLDGQPAMQVLLADTGISLQRPQQAFARLRHTMVGLSDEHEGAGARPGAFGVETRVRHLIGLEPSREAIAVADQVEAGMHLAFCQRNVEAARRDLVRICSEIREELEPQAALVAELPGDASGSPGSPRHPPETARRIAGALYISCAGRGGPHFGGPSAELQIVRHALGDVPLVGFFAAGEIAHRHLYGYTGVLTVFVND
ncbi:MAG: FIST N-terminal domain-containing protein [Pseudomonadota bacterium]